jgi:hypothetical protein
MIQLLGYGLGAEAMVTPFDAFLLQHAKPSSTDVANFLKAFAPGGERTVAAQQLIARGVPSNTVAAALNWLDAAGKIRSHKSTILGALALVSAAASGYHGYRRNQSIGWAMIWFLAGSILPVFTPLIAVAQGYGKPRKAS